MRMDRSRSKRSYYYDQEYDSPAPARTKGRYHHSSSNSHSHRRGGGGRPSKPPPPDSLPPPPAVFFRILCPDVKAGGVIGKSGSIIKTIRQETGAWINVHPLVAGDEERIIEISERRRDMSYSPAQEALLMIHERILESESTFGGGPDGGDGDEEDDYAGVRGGGGGSGSGGRVVTRMVVPRPNVGCLLGKGGKIIEQMRLETKTQIRILPRDHMPNCVSISEEIVQVVGDGNAVRKAIAIISSRLKESLLRDRSSFRGRFHSPERYFPPEDDFGHVNSIRPPLDGPASGMPLSNVRNNAYASRPSGYVFESSGLPATGSGQTVQREDIVFRILCPKDKVESVMGEADGIIEMLRSDIGVDVKVSTPVPGSDEHIIIVCSDEGPDDELFPAQEALLHIQSRIVDLGPDKDSVITTRLLIPAADIVCLEGRDGSLSEMRRMTRANIQILPREEFSRHASGDELIQIVGDIRAARDALVQITLRLRSHLYSESSFPKDLPPPPPLPAELASAFELNAGSPIRNSTCETFQEGESSISGYQNTQHATKTFQSKDTGRSVGGPSQQEESDSWEDGSSGPSRPTLPIVTKRILEVIIPDHAVPSLIMRSGSKLAQISEMSGATVSLVDDRPELSEKIVQISGSPEQAERAQSLLQGFILSTQDAPA